MNSRRPSGRPRRRARAGCAGAIGAFLILTGCNDGGAPENGADSTTAANAGATSGDVVDAGPEVVLEQLRTASQAGDWMSIYDLIHARSKVDEETVRWRRTATRARAEYHATMREAFGDAAGPYIAREPNDDLAQLAAALEGARIEVMSGRKAEILPPAGPGVPTPIAELVKVTGEWKIEPAFLNDGEPLTEPGFFMVQARYRAQAKFPRDVAAAIRAGEFETADEAAARLQELMTGPPPPLGAVVAD